MDHVSVSDIPHWYAIHTKINQENRADDNLRAWGVETFTPKIRERRPNPFTGEPGVITKPLFPRYIFAHFNAYKLLHKINFTRGVQSTVSVSGVPSRVDDEIIEYIKSRRGEDGFIRLGEDLRSGDRVIVNAGYLKDFPGIFEKRLKGEKRVSVLLTAINYQCRVVIAQACLRRAS
jgi:transcription elongation factor/antiterminator RfaH